MQAFSKIEIVFVTLASFRMLFHNQFCPSHSCEDLSVALLHFHHIVQFSRCSAPASFEARSQSLISKALRSNNNLFGGPEWARTTDLAIISRTL